MKSFKTYIVEVLIPKAGTQMGSNPGGIHVDSETGDKHYVKFYKNPDQAKSEALASKIYNHMGIKTLNPEHKVMDGKHAVTTKYNDNLQSMKPKQFENLSHEQAHQIGKMYHGAVLTKNWDIVGLEHDNIMKNKHTNDLHSIDTGGTFNFRAQGGHKDYGDDIDEHHSLRHFGGPSSHVFNHTFEHHPEAEMEGAKSVANMDDKHIHHLFKNSGLENWQHLHNNFMSRKQKLLTHYGYGKGDKNPA